MYNVSQAYLIASKEPFQEHRVTGTIGSSNFDESNIISGTFHISNQCTNTADITLGSVFLGQLEATFTGINIGYTSWIGKDITVYAGLKLANNTWEDIPVGVYRIIEAKHTAEGVAVTAYDNMRKFDRKIKKAHFKNVEANLHTFVTIICSDCHITFGMTQEEFFELPNSSETTFVFGYTNETKKYSNDIETYRDLLFYVAQTLGCFATIDRNGYLVFRKYKSNVAENISDRQRLSGAQFADYITNYTGIYVTNMKDDTEDYYGYDYELINTEINLCNQELERIESDLVELQRQYDDHEITEEEYLAQKKVLETERKQCNKRLNWLYKARDKAQAGEEGTFMDLGANPFLQDDSSTVRERMRRRVLKALDPISYTPFTCDSVMGAHYDLGDVIYFTGGHAGTDGVFCCLMAFDWTYNAEYQMQGFGVDPSILNVKQRTDKKVKEANTNALNAKELSSGMDAPINSDGKQDDIYIKYAEKTTYQPIHEMSFDGYVTEDETQWTFVRPEDMAKLPARDGFKWDEEHGGYGFNVSGYVYKMIGTVEPDSHTLAHGWFGVPAIKIDIPVERATYKIRCRAKWECTDLAGSYYVGISTFTNDKDCSSGNPALLMPFTGIDTETDYEIIREFHPGSDWDVNDPVYIYIDMYFPFQATIPGKAQFSLSVQNLVIEKVLDPQTGRTDGGMTATTDRYIDKVYVKDEDPQTLQEYWKEIEYVAGIDDSAHSGLELDYKRYLHLTPEVMRAWIKADPPQAAQTCNRYCVRYTGKPDPSVDIAFWGNSGWLNKSIKKDSEGVYTIKNGGTVVDGTVEYCGYKITGLISGKRYYLNFKANFKDGTQFNNDYDKGLGIVLQTAGMIYTDDFSGDPHTFDPETGYCSFYRSTSAKFYDFSFVAAASTMYMFVTVGDITAGQTSSLTLSRFVLSQTEKAYVRNFYLYDTESEKWLQYKPWGSGDESGEGGASNLSDLDDVHFNDLQDGQGLYYDSESGEWQNGNMPIASANSLGGIKVGNNLSIDANGVLSATGGASDVELVELTQAEYDALTPEEKADPNVIYFVTDAGGGGGGGGTTVIANPTGTATDTLNKLQVGSVIYGVSGGSSSEIIPITDPTNTTSRTFTFAKTPKKISATYNSSDNWIGHWEFIWGDSYATLITKAKTLGLNASVGISSITYGSDGKSFTITGSNAFQALNSSGGYGQMYVEY